MSTGNFIRSSLLWIGFWWVPQAAKIEVIGLLVGFTNFIEKFKNNYETKSVVFQDKHMEVR